MTRASHREVRDLRRQVREWRRGRADTTVLEALSDAYIALLATCMLSAMAVSAVLETRVAISASCTTTACADARYSASWVGLAAVLALTLTSARAVGPVQVTPAEGSWLLAAPVDRSAVLRSRLGRVVAVSAVGSGLVGAVGSVLAGFDWSVVALVGVGCGAAGTAAGMYAVLVQVRGGEAARAARVLTWVLAAAAWTGLLLVALGAAPSPRTGDAWVAPARLAAAVAVVLAALALVVRATTVLPRLGRGRLVPGGALLASVSGAFASLDLALLYDVLVARQWLARSTVRPVRSGPKGAWALAWRDVIRLRRSPTAIVALAAAAVVPYVVVTVDLGAVVVVAGSLTLFAVGLPLCSALRTTSNSPALVRCFPMSPVAVRAVPGRAGDRVRALVRGHVAGCRRRNAGERGRIRADVACGRCGRARCGDTLVARSSAGLLALGRVLAGRCGPGRAGGERIPRVRRAAPARHSSADRSWYGRRGGVTHAGRGRPGRPGPA